MTIEEFLKTDKSKNHCNVLIMPDGSIEYAEPDHLSNLIKATGMPENEACRMIPVTAHPLNWLVEFTGIGTVWFDSFIMPIGINMNQIRTLQLLMRAGKVSTNSYGMLTNEMSLCNAIAFHDRNADVGVSIPNISIWNLQRYCKDKAKIA